MKHAVAEPIVEIVAAALGLARRLLSFAFRAARLAHDAHMEMIVVPPPWAHLVQEGAILASLAAARTNSLLASGDSHLTALNGGYHVAFLVGALFAALAAVLGAALLRITIAAAPSKVEFGA